MDKWLDLVPDGCIEKEVEAVSISDFYAANIWEYEELVY